MESGVVRRKEILHLQEGIYQQEFLTRLRVLDPKAMHQSQILPNWSMSM
jgi:hypothetical protein